MTQDPRLSQINRRLDAAETSTLTWSIGGVILVFACMVFVENFADTIRPADKLAEFGKFVFGGIINRLI